VTSVEGIVRRKPWLVYALLTTVFWGVWGAFAGLPTQHGFPETLVYVVWALTMIPPALFALWRIGWKIVHDARSVYLGAMIGLLGAGGQMLLFHAVHVGPTWLIFPIIALSPVVTIALSLVVLGERVSRVGAIGIVLALLALPMFDYDPGASSATRGLAWFFYALIILAAWGIQAFYMKLANRTMSAEAIFFYMTITGLLLIPVALWMTDYSQPINYGWNGPWLAALTQILNSVGALTLVFAFRYGKAIIVAPLTNAGAPLMTAVIALAVSGLVPPSLKLLGLALAFIAAALLAIEPEDSA